MIVDTISGAKEKFSEYLDMIESGQVDCIVICRGDKPIAKLVPYENPECSDPKRTISIDADADEVSDSKSEELLDPIRDAGGIDFPESQRHQPRGFTFINE